MRKLGRQLDLSFHRRGGARAGAGRPPKGATPGVSHLRRPSHSRHHPLHLTLRVQRGVPSLRDRSIFAAVRAALAAGKQRFGFSLVHFSVQSNHLHLIAEAFDQRALSRGVQGLAIRIARAVNRRICRSGRLFADRYHAHSLKTPREVSFALRYVLLNARKHAPRGRRPPSLSLPPGFVDACSSAPWFSHFARPLELGFGAREARSEWARDSGDADPPVSSPGTWLLRTAVQRADFDVDDVPGG